MNEFSSDPGGVRVIDDPDMTIDEWLDLLHRLHDEHGGDAYVYINAGHNNAQLMVSDFPPNIGTGRPV